MPEKTYSEAYKKINPKTINAVHSLIRADRFFKQTKEKKAELLNKLFTELKSIYNVSGTLTIDLSRELKPLVTNACYNGLSKAIYLDKPSLVSFLHEFKHLIQDQKRKENSEDIARCWSLSLFKLSSPACYNIAKNKGLLIFN